MSIARSPRLCGKMRPAASTPGFRAVADAGGSLCEPRRASRGAVILELNATELLSAVINVAQNKWEWGELNPDLLPWAEFGTARGRRLAETHDRNGQGLPGFFEEVYELILEANRRRVSLH